MESLSRKIKVLYIAGPGRSGSTMVHNILGQCPGFLAVGEVRYIWQHGFLGNRECGCGRPFHECTTWQAILERAFGDWSAIDAEALYHATESFRIHQMPLMAIPAYRRKTLTRLTSYLESVASLYEAIQFTSGSSVIVDSSKNPAYAYLLQELGCIDLYIVHFLRDPRAVAYSWSKRKSFRPDGDMRDPMPRKHPLKSALQWNARNLGADWGLRHDHGHWLTTRYEDFTANPRKAIAAIVEMVGGDPERLPFASEDRIQLDVVNHSVFGNPVRLQQGEVQIRRDLGWQEAMPAGQQRLVQMVTWPTRLRYGYGRRHANGESHHLIKAGTA